MTTLDLCVATIRAAIAEIPQPWRTQLAVRLRRALGAATWEARDGELAAIEVELLVIREANAARCAP